MNSTFIAVLTIFAVLAVVALVMAILAYTDRKHTKTATGDDSFQQIETKTLEVSGVSYPTAQGTAGQVMSLSSSSKLGFETPVASGIQYTPALATARLSSTTVSGALDELEANKLASGLLGAKGDLLTRNGSAPASLPVGSTGQLLTADPTTSTGLSWSTVDDVPLNLDYYVSPAGSDSNDGKSVSKPFLTLQKAMETLETLVWGGTATVHLAAGTYTQNAFSWKPQGAVVIEGETAPNADFGDGKIASGTQGGQPTFDTVVSATAFGADVYAGKQIVITQGSVVTRGIIVGSTHGTETLNFINTYSTKAPYAAGTTTFEVLDYKTTVSLGGELTIDGDVQFGSLIVSGGSVNAAGALDFVGTTIGSSVDINNFSHCDFGFGQQGGLGCYLTHSTMGPELCNVNLFSSFATASVYGQFNLTGCSSNFKSNVIAGSVDLVINGGNMQFSDVKMDADSSMGGDATIFASTFSNTHNFGNGSASYGTVTFQNRVFWNACSVSSTSLTFSTAFNASENVLSAQNCQLALVNGSNTFTNTTGGTGVVAINLTNCNGQIGGASVTGVSKALQMSGSTMRLTSTWTFDTVVTGFTVQNGSFCDLQGTFGAVTGTMTDGFVLKQNSSAHFQAVPAPAGTITNQITVGVNAASTFALVVGSGLATSATSDLTASPSQFCSVTQG